MTSRDKMLAAIQKSKPEAVPLPDIVTTTRFENPVEQFTSILQAIGGTVIRIETAEAAATFLAETNMSHRIVVNGVPSLGALTLHQYVDAKATAIEEVHIVMLRGGIGVAENGAVWLPESAMGNRLLPFLCLHLVLVVAERDIVHTMHDAYASIRAGAEGYGVFIAGPSKTADIEQSLVLGAHGPLSLQVLLVNESLL